jgi:predicted hydrocarbon binding protein
MFVALSHFDAVEGPRVFASLPTELPTQVEDTISALMDLRSDTAAFEFVVPGLNLKLVNLSFEVPSEWARGRAEILMVTLVVEAKQESATLPPILEDFKQGLLNEPEIFRGFYCGRREEGEAARYHGLILESLRELYKRGLSQLEKLQFVDALFARSEPRGEVAPAEVIQSLVSAFITVIDSRSPDGARLLHEVGTILGTKFAGYFSSEELEGLLGEVATFWKKLGLGQIELQRIDETGVHFHVYSCFECSHLPDIGATVCKYDEGFLTSLLQKKLHERFVAQELDCYANGADHCYFLVRR